MVPPHVAPGRDQTQAEENLDVFVRFALVDARLWVQHDVHMIRIVYVHEQSISHPHFPHVSIYFAELHHSAYYLWTWEIVNIIK